MLRLVLLLACLWALLALWYFEPWPAWVRVAAAVLWGAGVFAAWLFLEKSEKSLAPRAVAVGVLVVLLAWSLLRPSNDRNWIPDQARMPVVRFDGDQVHIENFRYATYRTGDDADVRWLDRSYDLEGIESVDFLVTAFASWRGPAHTFLTFGFQDGRHVAISVEARKEQGEAYSAVQGLFKRYEVMYVVGDERDLVGLRINVHKDPTYLFPIKASKERIREMFVSMLERADQLGREPEFYNTVTSTCTTNIVGHLEHVRRESLGFDVRLLFPGYSDRLAVDLGLIDFDGDLEQARDRFRIAGPVPITEDGPGWSKKIREGR